MMVDMCGKHSQVGSVAGAAHLLNDNAGVLRWVEWELKSHVDYKGKARLISICSTNTNFENIAYRSFILKKCAANGDRKITTRIFGTWQRSVNSDVACWSCDVGLSYHWDADILKYRIVLPPIGNVSWGLTVVRHDI